MAGPSSRQRSAFGTGFASRGWGGLEGGLDLRGGLDLGYGLRLRQRLDLGGTAFFGAFRHTDGYGRAERPFPIVTRYGSF